LEQSESTLELITTTSMCELEEATSL